MNDVAEWIVIGRFGRTHGIKGLITVNSFMEPRDNILNYAQWYGYINKQWQALKLISVETTDKHILARVDGYSEREQVAQLTNIDIGVPKEELPGLAEGEYYWHQLIGMKVINQQNDELGKVVDMMPTGANDVLVVEGERRHLIPYLPDHSIISIDLAQQSIIVDWDKDF